MNTAVAVKTIREKLGESQQVFSGRLGTTLMTVSRWERDLYTPEPAKLAQLARLARELQLTEAAAVIEKEAGGQFQKFGPEMLQEVWGAFEWINAKITKFTGEAARGGFGKDIPKELWGELENALNTSIDGQGTVVELMAIAPHVGPR